ncbi:MAG: hypothetical protein LC808_01335 [Actinobacteria bacterium]|nr:hypothetical protein [Actinomycetota bacterium]
MVQNVGSSSIGASRSEATIQRTVALGATGGIIAAVVMAIYAMVAAATYQHTGFFTPMYHIASSVMSPSTMMASAKDASQGHLFDLSLGPALVGLVVHMVVGAAYGIVFALLARLLTLRGVTLVLAGALFGLVAMGISSVALLPATASLLGGGEPISDMPTIVGWPTFSLEHILFGVVLGAILALRGDGLGSRATSSRQVRATA